VKDKKALNKKILIEAEKDVDGSQYLTFKEGNEIYGISISSIKEVLNYISIRNIPLTPGYIKGILNLRGNLLPVIDLSYHFYKRISEINKSSSIIVVEQNYEEDTMQVGLLVDAVNEVIFIPEESIDAKPDFGTKIRSDYIKGVGKLASKYIIILNLSAFLNMDELSNFEKE